MMELSWLSIKPSSWTSTGERILIHCYCSHAGRLQQRLGERNPNSIFYVQDLYTISEDSEDGGFRRHSADISKYGVSTEYVISLTQWSSSASPTVELPSGMTCLIETTLSDPHNRFS